MSSFIIFYFKDSKKYKTNQRGHKKSPQIEGFFKVYKEFII